MPVPASPDTGVSHPTRAPRFLPGTVATVVVALLAIATTAILLQPGRASRREVHTLVQRAAFGSPVERRDARSALLERSTESAPVLVRILRTSKTRWRTHLLPWLESIPQVANLRTRHLRVERVAIDLLQTMGPETTPALLPLLSENRLGGRDTALALIRSRGPAVCPILIRTLHDPDPTLRAGAAMALGKFPADTLGSLAPLLGARKDPDSTVRASTLWALGQFADRPADVAPALIEALSDRSKPVRLQALQSLRGFSPHATPAVPALRRILAADAPALRIEAAVGLALLGSAARDAEPELAAMLAGSSDVVRRQAAVTLLTLDLRPDEALACLAALLARTDQPFLTRTLETVGGLGPKAIPLVPRLLAFLENDNPRDDRPTLNALRQIQPDAIPERFRRGRPPTPSPSQTPP